MSKYNSFSTSNILIQLDISRLQNFQLCQESAIFPNSPDHGHFPKTPNFANVPLTNWGGGSRVQPDEICSH